MQGRHRAVVRGGWRFLLLAIVGCGDAPAPLLPELPPPEIGAHFDARTTGTVEGQLTWVGEVPQVSPFVSTPRPVADPPRAPKRPWPNSNAPSVDFRTRGVGDVVVFLRGIDPEHSRPWDHDSVRVEMSGYRYQVHQGRTTSRFGFVRRGRQVEMVSTDEAFYSARARGAAFFTLPFPDPHRPCQRTLLEKGVVELSSGSGQFWMRAYLFVDDHPYYARTDSQGHFSLAQVPEGEYELVCWLPDWRVARRERDPESTLTARLFFSPPVELVRRVTVHRGEKCSVAVDVSAEAFARQP
ncbi:MAG: hypothetical protein HYS12_26335 [Planctomycetes bacterium]|nr:hypothetical protein [Planctomycetota bacterium]